MTITTGEYVMSPEDYAKTGLLTQPVYTPSIPSDNTTADSAFDSAAYLQNKTDWLNDPANNQPNPDNPSGGLWTVEQTNQALVDAGMTPQSHFDQYGRDEGISPYAAASASVERVPRESSNPRQDKNQEVPGDTLRDPSLVEDRMNNLLDSDNPYITSARRRADQESNARGLLNSSINMKAGEAAAIEAAYPIASSDAAAINQFKQIDIQAQNTMELLKTEASIQQDFQNNQNEFTRIIEAMNLTTEETKAIGSSVTVLGQQLATQVGAIQADAGMTATAKTKIIQQLNDMYKAQLDSITAIYDVPLVWS